MADNKKSSISRRSTCYLLNLKAPEKTAKRLKLSFQRTAASVKLVKSDRDVDAAIGFLDVSETGAGVFTPELLHKGAVVELTITEPAHMRVRGIVAWSIPVTSGIHAGKFRCRSGIQFVFENEAQAQSLRDFATRAGQDPIENIRNAKPPISVAEAAAMASMAGAVDPSSAPPLEGTEAVVAPVEGLAPTVEVAAVVTEISAVAEAPAAEAVAAETVAAETPVSTEEPKAA
jgi:hypothetical protein